MWTTPNRSARTGAVTTVRAISVRTATAAGRRRNRVFALRKWILAVPLELGALGICVGIVLHYAWSLLVVLWGFQSGGRAEKAPWMRAEREEGRNTADD